MITDALFLRNPIIVLPEVRHTWALVPMHTHMHTKTYAHTNTHRHIDTTQAQGHTGQSFTNA